MSQSLSRRSFLKCAGSGAVSLAAALLTGVSAAALAPCYEGEPALLDGKAAVELLVRLIRQEPVECKNYVQPVELIRRNSVCESTPNAAPWSQDLHKTHK